MVELLLTLLVLYGLQCVVLLPRGATLFVRPAGAWLASEGPGWRLLHPWPSAPIWLAARPPLRSGDDGLRTRGPTPWLGAGLAEGTGPRIVPGSGQSVTVRGSRVRIDGVPALRAANRRQAAAQAEELRALVAEAAPADRVLEEGLVRCFDPAAVSRARSRASAATRWLGRLSDLALVALLAALPALAATLGSERALLLFAPGWLALDVALLVLLHRAHATLHPEGGDRFELLLAAALYPPLLLRAAGELRREALCGFHPAAVAAEVLPREAALDFLRGELARCSEERERAAVARVVARLGSSPAALFAPPERSDPLARSYCPTCRTEYRRDDGACVDCGGALAPLAATGSPGEASGRALGS